MPARRETLGEVRAWLGEAAIPLTSAEPGQGFADLEPFRTIVGDARIVDMGEVSHGQHECFAFKHRLFEFLVAEMGFTGFVFEGWFTDALAINRYVLTGQGTAADALTGMRMWVWDTTEVLALIEWMRAWNADPAHERKLQFFGSWQWSPPVGAQRVLAYLRRVDPDRYQAALPALGLFANDFTVVFYRQLSSDTRRDARRTLSDLVDAFRRHEAEWSTKTGAAEFDLVHVLARMLYEVELEALDPSPETLSDAARFDRSLANGILACLKLAGPGARLATWAHNGHAQLGPSVYPTPKPSPAMGGCLREALGEDVVAIGFAGNRGAYHATDEAISGIYAREVPAAPEGTFDAALAEVGHPLFAIDLRTAPDGPVDEWLATGPATRWLPISYDTDQPDFGIEKGVLIKRVDVRTLFDVVVFVETTTASHLNPTASPDLFTPHYPGLLEFGKVVDFGEVLPAPEPALVDGPTGELAAAWTFSRAAQSRYRVDVDNGSSTRASVTIGRDRVPWTWGMGTLVQRFDAAPHRERVLRFHAVARVNDTPVDGPGVGDTARLFVQVDGYSGGGPQFWLDEAVRTRLHQVMIEGTGWARYTVDAEIPITATRITVGVAVTGEANLSVAEIVVDQRHG